MGTLIALGAVLIAALVFGLGLVAQRRFEAGLDRLQAALGRPVATARRDLPSEVRALAQRLGAGREPFPGRIEMGQRGTMWRAPEARPMRFVARQLTDVAQAGFVWRATFGRAGLVRVADYLVAGAGGLEARALGLLSVARDVGTEAIAQGEAMRYLAELPWNPDAIVLNRGLEWTVVDVRTLRVATGAGGTRAEVTLHLDGPGDVVAVSAPSRPRREAGKLVARPWAGRFRDYRNIGGRRIPWVGEVAWTLEGREFVYWRATLEHWEAR